MFVHRYIIGCRWAIRNRRGIRIGSSGGNRGGKCTGAHYETAEGKGVSFEGIELSPDSLLYKYVKNLDENINFIEVRNKL